MSWRYLSHSPLVGTNKPSICICNISTGNWFHCTAGTNWGHVDQTWCWSVCSAIWGFLLYQNRLRWPSDLHPSIHSCWQWVCPDLWPLTLERLKVFFLLTFWSKLSSPDIRNIYCSLQPGRIVPLQLNPWCPLSALASVPSFFGDCEFKQSISFLISHDSHTSPTLV